MEYILLSLTLGSPSPRSRAVRDPSCQGPMIERWKSVSCLTCQWHVHIFHIRGSHSIRLTGRYAFKYHRNRRL
ncbi:hypothetical protein BDW68DRAFT_155825 [Aspergillus falconensis]